MISIAMIGACTALIGDIASHLGCFIFLKDSVNAIAFVALGTSVPGEHLTRVSDLKDSAFQILVLSFSDSPLRTGVWI